MPRGDTSSYSDKQRRQAERCAWANVNKETGGGKKSGSGRGQPENHEPSRTAAANPSSR